MSDSPATRICEFARRYRSERERTPHQLYEATGYSASFSHITQQDIEAVVAHDGALVGDWLSFTEDKRWTPAWGLHKRGDMWVVFHIREGAVRSYEVAFDSSIPACALMIRMEMEDFRLREK